MLLLFFMLKAESGDEDSKCYWIHLVFCLVHVADRLPWLKRRISMIEDQSTMMMKQKIKMERWTRSKNHCRLRDDDD